MVFMVFKKLNWLKILLFSEKTKTPALFLQAGVKK